MAHPSITKIARFGLVTADVAASTAFFIEAFDAVVTARRGEDPAFCALLGLPSARATQTCLRIGAEEIALIAFETAGRPYPAASTSSDLWFQHFAIIVSDMEAAYARLSHVGRFQPISIDGPCALPPSSGSVTAFKFRDAEGHPLELLAFPEGGAPPYWREKAAGALFLGIDHSAIAVHDTGASLAFFQAAFGLTLGMQSENQGPEQAAMDAIEDARVTVSGLMPKQAPPHVELLGYKVGRRRPIDDRTRSDDVAATSFVLQTTDLLAVAEALTALKARFVSPGIVTLADGTQALMVLDPDGHRFIVEQPAG
jgi:catechol 2,3-dioxygenase-like lactoylglutathione lyase family enzyme